MVYSLLKTAQNGEKPALGKDKSYMNILILFSQPWRTGGAETHVEAMIAGLPEQQIFLAVNQGSNVEKLNQLRGKYKNIEIVEIQTRGIDLFRWQSDLRKLADFIHQNKIDIISAQQRTAGIWAYFLHRKTAVPYTITMHDPWHRAKLVSIYKYIFPIMIVVSANLKEMLKNKYDFPESKINLIDNGIDFSTFFPINKIEAREKLGLNNDDKIILHVSRLSGVKGAVSLVLIDAMSELDDNNNYKLIIIGEGPLRVEIEKKIDVFNANHKNKIEIYDFVEGISDWYNAADMLVGEGRVAIETLACLRPIVAIRNSKLFIGSVNKENIEYSCDVNFDGRDIPVTPQNIGIEIEKAFKLQDDDIDYIAGYVKKRLSLNKMASDYIKIFNKCLSK